MTQNTILLGGQPVELGGRPLKTGGQALVYPVSGQDGIVVKIYRDPPEAEQERRLERMLTMAPLTTRATHAGQPPELAWPMAIARSPDGRFLGYAMPRFSEPGHVPLPALFNRRTRVSRFGERADWRFLLGVSWNLAFMTARMHHERLVIGDFSSNNVVVDKNGFVTFLDCDSIAFTDPVSAEAFPCQMVTPDYCAPERHHGGPADPSTDDFALAILIYQLLTGGNHPFSGVPHDLDPDEESSLKSNIVSRRSYVVHPGAIRVPPASLDPSILPQGILALARTAFAAGVEDPSMRPKAADWVEALDEERSRIRTCADRPRHTYPSHLTSCPWCARAVTTGHDLFNEPGPSIPAITQTPDPAPPQAARNPLVPVLAIVAIVILLVILLAIA